MRPSESPQSGRRERGWGRGGDKRKEVGRGGLRPALTEERSESEACLLIGGMSYETSEAVSDCQ